MTKLGLSLNEEKTSVKNARREPFDFLGYCLGHAICRTVVGGIWEPACPRRVCSGSRPKSARADAGQ